MLIVKNKDAKKKTPHLALTHESNGPANGRRVSLVMKGIEEFSPEAREALQAILKSQNPHEEVEKATYETLRRSIDQAIDAHVKRKDRWGWAWVRDFDNDNIIYSTGDGVYAVNYSINDGEVVIGDEEISVNEMLSWEDSSGKVVVSQSNSISSNVGNLVIKSFSSPQGDEEKIQEIFKSLYMEEKQMDELKAQNEELKAEVEKAKAAAKEATALVESLKAELAKREEEDAKKRAEARLAVIKSVVAEGEVEAISKSLEALNDEAFDTVMKSMKSAKELADQQSGMFTQVSKSAKAPEAPVNMTGVEALAELLKKAQ